ncbi:MAG: hypothetical protein WED34_19550, partial [Planctomycetales bacterium]
IGLRLWPEFIIVTGAFRRGKRGKRGRSSFSGREKGDAALFRFGREKGDAALFRFGIFRA